MSNSRRLCLLSMCLCLLSSSLLSAFAQNTEQQEVTEKAKSPEKTVEEVVPSVDTKDKATEPNEASEKTGEKKTSPLPWENAIPQNLPGKKIQNLKEYFQWMGIDASQWNNFYHDQPLGASDEEYINRLIVRLHRVGQESLISYRQPEMNFETIKADPAKFQGETYALHGHVIQVETVPLPKELVDRYEFDKTYRVTVQLEKPEEQAIVCLENVPAMWLQENAKLHEPVSGDAVFIKASPRENAPTQLAFVAKHLAWHPVVGTVIPEITPELITLGTIGLDISLFNEINTRNFHKLTEADTEPFYEMLRVSRNFDKIHLPNLDKAPIISVAHTLSHAKEMHGKLVTVEGRLERAQKIAIDSSAWQTRLGMQHYYELYVFVPVGDEGIKWSRSKDDPHPRMFSNSFPVTVCVPELPEAIVKNPNGRELVRISGAFFKVWTYRPQGEGNDLPQPSPLIIANHVTILPPVKLQSAEWDRAGAIIVLAGILVIGWILAQQFRTPAKMQNPLPDKLELPKPPENPSES